MARRKDHTRDELKQMILDAAWSIIENEGHEGLTARKVAKEIGYTAGTIYNVFQSMEDLSLHINSITLDKLYKELSGPELLIPQKKPIRSIKLMAHTYSRFAKKFRAHWLALFTHSLPEGVTAPKWYQDKIDLMFEPLEYLLTPYYVISKRKERRLAARVLWASVHGIYFLEETGKVPLIGKKASAPKMVNFMIDNFIEGITSKPS